MTDEQEEKTPKSLTLEYQREKCRKFYLARKLRDPKAHQAKQSRNSKAWRARNPEKVRQKSANNRKKAPDYYREACRRSNLKAKSAVISAYGGKCQCGIDDPDVLTIDHVGGGGNDHRKSLGQRSGGLWRTVLREGCPERYRLLCRNCNMRDHLSRQRESQAATQAALCERLRKARYKAEAFAQYGGAVCSLCAGFTGDMDALSLDHIDPCGGGRNRACGWHLYLALRKAGWPAGYRVVCLNCNWKCHMASAST